jgi:hypothetical protein
MSSGRREFIPIEVNFEFSMLFWVFLKHYFDKLRTILTSCDQPGPIKTVRDGPELA